MKAKQSQTDAGLNIHIVIYEPGTRPAVNLKRSVLDEVEYSKQHVPHLVLVAYSNAELEIYLTFPNGREPLHGYLISAQNAEVIMNHIRQAWVANSVTMRAIKLVEEQVKRAEALCQPI